MNREWNNFRSRFLFLKFIVKYKDTKPLPSRSVKSAGFPLIHLQRQAFERENTSSDIRLRESEAFLRARFDLFLHSQTPCRLPGL